MHGRILRRLWHRFRTFPGAKDVWTLKTLHRFNGTDGSGPPSTLVFDKAGNLYGTTQLNGANDAGTVFQLHRASNGAWGLKTLHNFTGTDGLLAEGALVFDSAGNLYGTTRLGGANDTGTVFKLAPNADGTWTENVLVSFGTSGGVQPIVGVIFDSAGNLFGTTSSDGSVTAPSLAMCSNSRRTRMAAGPGPPCTTSPVTREVRLKALPSTRLEIWLASCCSAPRRIPVSSINLRRARGHSQSFTCLPIPQTGRGRSARLFWIRLETFTAQPRAVESAVLERCSKSLRLTNRKLDLRRPSGRLVHCKIISFLPAKSCPDAIPPASGGSPARKRALHPDQTVPFAAGTFWERPHCVSVLATPSERMSEKSP